MLLSEIPGFAPAMAAAAAEEEALRDAAFLESTLEICGVPIVPLTLERTALLLFVGSPFLVGGAIEPPHIAQFLWILSPEYRPRDAAARAAFTAAIAFLSFEESRAEIDAMIDAELLDRPPRQSGPATVAITSYVASYIDLFAAEYGWTAREILQTRMACLYQYVRQIQRRQNPKTIFFNRITDRTRRQLLSQWRQAQASPRPKPKPARADTRRRKK